MNSQKRYPTDAEFVRLPGASIQPQTDTAGELDKEDEFFVELRTLLGVDDMRTIRYALESYYHQVGEDTDLGCGSLEDLGNLREEEDLQAHLEILSKITKAHWAIRYAANKAGVDC